MATHSCWLGAGCLAESYQWQIESPICNSVLLELRRLVFYPCTRHKSMHKMGVGMAQRSQVKFFVGQNPMKKQRTPGGARKAHGTAGTCPLPVLSPFPPMAPAPALGLHGGPPGGARMGSEVLCGPGPECQVSHPGFVTLDKLLGLVLCCRGFTRGTAIIWHTDST